MNKLDSMLEKYRDEAGFMDYEGLLDEIINQTVELLVEDEVSNATIVKVLGHFYL